VSDGTPEREAPAVSVVVACTRPERIAGLVEALGAELRAGAPALELLVAGRVDGIDASGLPAWTGLLGSADLHPNHLRQLCVDRATAPVIAFLDDDALPSPGWVRAAAAMDPAAREVWTGPEVPMRSTPGSALAADVGSSLLAEGSMAHVEARDRAVRWYEVPFCNLVIPRTLLDELGPLPSDIAWDIDDFELCARAAHLGATFRNRVELRIAHDRYPDTVAGWLTRKARARRRTGEKLVRHPGIYARVPGVAIAAVAPWAVVLVGRAVLRRRVGAQGRGAALVAVAAYLGLVVAEGVRAGRRGTELVRFVVGVAGLHVASVGALQLGIVEGLVGRATGREDRRLPAPYAGAPTEGLVAASPHRAVEGEGR
jgi:hypothetical protein